MKEKKRLFGAIPSEDEAFEVKLIISTFARWNCLSFTRNVGLHSHKSAHFHKLWWKVRTWATGDPDLLELLFIYSFISDANHRSLLFSLVFLLRHHHLPHLVVTINSNIITDSTRANYPPKCEVPAVCYSMTRRHIFHDVICKKICENFPHKKCCSIALEH